MEHGGIAGGTPVVSRENPVEMNNGVYCGTLPAPLDEKSFISGKGECMTIWVDADAMPRAVKEVLYRAAQRRKVEVVLVANAYLSVPDSAYIRTVRVEKRADVADDYIVEHCVKGDLIISADIPLAGNAVEKGVPVLQPHGRLLDEDNVDEVLSYRNFADDLRSFGIDTGGPPPYGNAQKNKFSNGLDRWLTQNGH